MNTRMQSTRPACSAGSNVSQGRDPGKHAGLDITGFAHLAPDVTSRRATIRMGLDEGLLKTDPKNVYEQRGRQPLEPGYSVSGVESRHATNQVMASRKVDTCGMSLAGLALPVFYKPAAVVTHGEKMKGPAGGNSCPSLDREDRQEAAACNAISPEQRPASRCDFSFFSNSNAPAPAPNTGSGHTSAKRNGVRWQLMHPNCSVTASSRWQIIL